VTLADLPDSTPIWIAGYGESTIGELVAARTAEEPEPLTDFERTVNMWADIVCANTNRQPWEPDLTFDQIRTYHATREPGDPARIFD